MITNVGPVRVIDESEHLPAAGLSPIAAAIEVENLTKSYGDVAAVAGLDLEIQAGEIFALLGPNGAGKTTTVEILRATGTATAAASQSSATTPTASAGS